MHWRNSNFQIKHFIAGKCHTPDEAYRQLLQLYEDRDVAIKHVKATTLRAEAKVAKAQYTIESGETKTWEKLEAEADLAELEAHADQSKAVLEQALAEREYIKSLMADLLPQCQYFGSLSDHEASQACQQEEWKLELMWRAENFLGSQGMIPHDHLATMRSHPEWKTISGHVQNLIELHQQGKPFEALPSHQDVILMLEDKSSD